MKTLMEVLAVIVIVVAGSLSARAEKGQATPPTLEQCATYYYLWQPTKGVKGVTAVFDLLEHNDKLTDADLLNRVGMMDMA